MDAPRCRARQPAHAAREAHVTRSKAMRRNERGWCGSGAGGEGGGSDDGGTVKARPPPEGRKGVGEFASLRGSDQRGDKGGDDGGVRGKSGCGDSGGKAKARPQPCCSRGSRDAKQSNTK